MEGFLPPDIERDLLAVLARLEQQTQYAHQLVVQRCSEDLDGQCTLGSVKSRPFEVYDVTEPELRALEGHYVNKKEAERRVEELIWAANRIQVGPTKKRAWWCDECSSFGTRNEKTHQNTCLMAKCQTIGCSNPHSYPKCRQYLDIFFHPLSLSVTMLGGHMGRSRGRKSRTIGRIRMELGGK